MKDNLLTFLVLHFGLAAVAAQPVITNQPQNQTAIAGATARFTVGATGAQPLSYQWRSHANPNSYTNIPFGTEATLVLTNVQPSSRRFAVVVTDSGGLSVTSSPLVALTVVTPPSITPTNPTASLFADLTLLATNVAAGAISSQWLFNGEPIAGAVSNSLVVANVQKTSLGDYAFVATYALGSATSQVARITVTLFQSLYFFGGSWNDTGGNGCNWPALGYYQNRACNGPMWPEYVSTNLGLAYVVMNNRARCGATSGDILGQIASLPASRYARLSLFFVGEAVGDFLFAADNAYQAPSGDVPFVHWTNDLAWNGVLQRALQNSSNAVERLYQYGGRAIVMHGVFDLGLSPSFRNDFGNDSDRFQRLTERTSRFNSQLVSTLHVLQDGKPDLRLYYVDNFTQLNALQSGVGTNGLIKAYPDALSDTNFADKSFTGPGADYLYWDSIHVTSKAHRRIAEWNRVQIENATQEKLTAARIGEEIRLQVNHLLIGRDYTLQTSSDLASWNGVQTFTASAGTNQVTHPLSAGTASVFYRLQWPQ